MKFNIKDWYNLTKIDRTIIPVACFILGVLVFSNFSLLKLLPVLVPVLIYAGAASFNDVKDFRIDKVSNPNRPLVSKKITIREIYLITVILITFGLILAYLIGIWLDRPFFIILTLIWIIIGIGYSIVSSKHFISATATLGISHGVLPFLSAVYLFDITKVFSYESVTLMVTIWLTLFLLYNMKDFKDIEGDKKNKRVTLPLLKGTKFGKYIMFLNFILIFPITIVVRLLLRSTLIGFAISVAFSLGFVYLGWKLLVIDTKKGFLSIWSVYRYLIVFYILSFAII